MQMSRGRSPWTSSFLAVCSWKVRNDRCLSRVAVWPGPAKSLHLARLRSEVLTMKKDIQPNTQRSSAASCLSAAKVPLRGDEVGLSYA